MKNTIRTLSAVAAALLLAGCATVNSSTRADRLAAVASLSSQEDLYRAVHETRYRDARDAAARRVTRPDLCARLATRSDLSADVRAEIVGRVTDSAALAGIAADPDTPEEIRAAAVGRIDDSAVLLGLLRTKTVPEAIRLAALARVDDPAEMAGIAAANDEPEAIRRAALARIGDDEKAWISLLRAKPAPDAWVLDEAVGRVASPAALAAFAARREMPAVPRRAALAKISDPDAMVRVAALVGDDRELRRAALARIGDDGKRWARLLRANPRPEDWVLEEAIPRADDPERLAALLADRGLSAKLRILAVGRVDDQTALAAVVSDRGDSEEVRRAALARVTDEAVCAKLCTAVPAPEDWVLESALAHVSDSAILSGLLADRSAATTVRVRACERLDDQVALAAVAADREDAEPVRRAALARVTDEEICAKLCTAVPAPEDWVLESALGRVSDPGLLARFLADRSAASGVRAIAASRVDDQAVLSAIVGDDTDAEPVRRAALARISDEGVSLGLLAAEPVLEDWVLEKAVSNVASPGGLATVLLSEGLPEAVRASASERLSDAAERRRVFAESTDDYAAAATFDALDADALAAPAAQRRLLSLFREGKDAALRRRAMLALGPGADLVRSADQMRIARALLAGDGEDARAFARRTMFDRAAVTLVATKGGDALGAWALGLVQDPETAEKIALGAESVPVQCRAVALLRDEAQFARVARDGRSGAVRGSAAMNLTKASGDLLRKLAEDPDEAVRTAAVARLRDTGADRAAAKLATKSEAHRKAEEAARAKAELEEAERQAAEDRRAFEEEALAAAAASQIGGYRFFVDKRAEHPKIPPKAFRFTGRVAEGGRGSLSLGLPDGSGSRFSVEARLAERHSRKIGPGEIVTVSGTYREGSRDRVVLRDATVVREGL